MFCFSSIISKWLWRGIFICAMTGFASSAIAASHISPEKTPPDSTETIVEPPAVEVPKKETDAATPNPDQEEQSHDAEPSNVNEKPENKIETIGKVEDQDEETYPEIQRDLSKLPFPVRRMRELILEAARSGDIEKLRPLIGFGDDVTMLSLGGIDEDPIAFLKSLSGDPEGHELLAILSEVMEMGYVIMDEGTEQELYVWPYFFAWPLDRLSNPQKVELFRLATWGDFEEMQAFGAYIFYRSGITPRGRWRFFVAGD